MNQIFIDYIKEKLKDNFDVKFREIQVKEGKIYAVFIDNLSDSKIINEHIILPLMESEKLEDAEFVKSKILKVGSTGDIKSVQEAIYHILSGDVVLIFDFLDTAIFCEAKAMARRLPGENIRESVIKGSHEAFAELIVDNIALIRRRTKNEDLKFEMFTVGKKSNTSVALAYIKGVAPDRLVDFVREKIKGADVEFVLDSSYIEEELKTKATIFDTVETTERPDKVVSRLCEGRIAIIIDGSPEAITAPFFFIENFMASDDYYFNKYFTAFVRSQRWLAFFLALLLPAIYIAIGTHHFSLIPIAFVFRMATSRAGIPFPTVVELMLMMFFFQLLREAGVRLPQPTGQTMGIVGALILGDAAIGAGLASQATIVIVAVASISTFLIPNLYKNVSIWSMIIVFFSSFLGLPGFYMGFFVFLAHISTLESCGYPFLYPLGSLELFKYNDVILRGDLNKISNSMFLEDVRPEDSNNNQDNNSDQDSNQNEENSHQDSSNKNKGKEQKDDKKQKNNKDAEDENTHKDESKQKDDTQ